MIIPEERLLILRHLRSMRKLSAELEDALHQLVEARRALLDAFQYQMTPEIQLIVDDANALSVQLEAMYLANEDRIASVSRAAHSSSS